MITRDRAVPRAGFTLIELMVVIAIIGVLVTLALLVAPRFSERQKVTMGAGQLQGTLFTAKQRAFRDNLTRGVRFLPNTVGLTAVGGGMATVQVADLTGIEPGMRVAVDLGSQAMEGVDVLSTNPGAGTFTGVFTKPHGGSGPYPITPYWATQLQYLEQPDNFVAGSVFWADNPGSATNPTYLPSPPYPPTSPPGGIQYPTVVLAFPTPNPPGIMLENIVTPGQDFLFLHGGQEPHLIHDVDNGFVDNSTNPPTKYYQVHLMPPPPNGNGSNVQTPIPPRSHQTDYWIERAPQPLATEPVVKLPQDVVVNFYPFGPPGSQNAGLNPPSSTDLLFTPTGSVRQAGGAGKFIYWVHDKTVQPWEGEPTLIAVFTRTGAIAAHPPNVDPSGALNLGGPYKFVQDGRASGM